MTQHETTKADTFSVRGQGGNTVATISGDLGITSVSMVRKRFLHLLNPQANRIIVDLSGVTSCDVSGLAVLVAAGRRARLLGGVLYLAAPAPAVTAVLRLTGLDSHFEIFATAATAAGARRHLGLPDVSLRRSLPMSQLSTRSRHQLNGLPKVKVQTQQP